MSITQSKQKRFKKDGTEYKEAKPVIIDTSIDFMGQIEKFAEKKKQEEESGRFLPLKKVLLRHFPTFKEKGLDCKIVYEALLENGHSVGTEANFRNVWNKVALELKDPEAIERRKKNVKNRPEKANEKSDKGKAQVQAQNTNQKQSSDPKPNTQPAKNSEAVTSKDTPQYLQGSTLSIPFDQPA